MERRAKKCHLYWCARWGRREEDESQQKQIKTSAWVAQSTAAESTFWWMNSRNPGTPKGVAFDVGK